MPGRHVMLPPLFRRGDKQGQHIRVFSAAGGRESEVVVNA
ncbi:hypothetical protein CSC02_0488 [Enterobacter hormaechei subsp. hoffmannii]|nr:hypothetical protein CSC02_0488 [Enterobacter hormaechei subsp. hoffmannii]